MNRRGYQAEIHGVANAIGMSGAPASDVAARLRAIAERLDGEATERPYVAEEAPVESDATVEVDE